MHVTSNGVAVPFTDAYFAPMSDSSPLCGDAAALRARYAEDGYLLLRGVLPGDRVLSLRAAYLALFRADDGTGALPHGVAGHPAHAFVRGEQFASFVAASELAAPAQALLGGPVTLLPRQILRHFRRGTAIASRAHRDLEYLDRGDADVVTTWIPVGDCPLATGGLIYLDSSHRLAAGDLAPLRSVTDRPHDSRPISHDLALVADTLGR